MTSSGLYGKPLSGYGTYPAACAAHLRGKKTPVLSDLMAMGMEHPYLTQDGPDFDAGLLKVRPFLPTSTQYIANCQDGFHAMYRYFEMEAGTRSISVMAHGDAEGTLLIKNSEDGEILGSIAITPSASKEWNETNVTEQITSMFMQPKKNWEEYTGEVTFPQGVTEIHFIYEGRGSFDFLSFTI